MADRILVVDDEEGIRKVLNISLSDLGYNVSTAESGEEALNVFSETHPSIVLTDIKMPGMDGLELLGKIKNQNPDTEVIMITGHGDMDLAIKSLQLDATDFVTKPINDDVLGIALKRAQERITMRNQIREYTENLEKLVRQQSARLVATERELAAYQVIEGLSSAIGDIAGDLSGGIKFFNELPCFVSLHSKDLKILQNNELYRERFGDKTGEPSWAVYSDEEAQGEKCPVAQTYATGKGQRRRRNVKGIDGTEFPVSVNTAPIRDREGKIELVLEISVDVTEVKRLQDELQATQQKYQQLFDEVPCYISVQDKDFRLTATNRRFKEDFGEDIGSHCFQVYKHRHEPCSDCPVAKTFEDGQSHQAEMVVTSKSGEHYNVLIGTAPIRNASGEIVQVMEMSTNITEIRQLQSHLSSLGLLIGTVSHGIKGLLTGLDSGIYLLNSGFAKDNKDDIEEGWETVRVMVDRIRSMVLNILYYAKERDLETETINTLNFANEVASVIEAKAENRGVTFTRDFDESVDGFEVDAGVFRSALINVLENAVDACEAKKTDEGCSVRFGVHQETDYIVFDVQDNGIGMDDETREKMFTLFFSSKGSKGTGLGLFVSHQIVTQHGGSIEVDSAEGKGAHFQIKMPKKLTKQAKAHREESQLRELKLSDADGQVPR